MRMPLYRCNRSQANPLSPAKHELPDQPCSTCGTDLAEPPVSYGRDGQHIGIASTWWSLAIGAPKSHTGSHASLRRKCRAAHDHACVRGRRDCRVGRQMTPHRQHRRQHQRVHPQPGLPGSGAAGREAAGRPHRGSAGSRARPASHEGGRNELLAIARGEIDRSPPSCALRRCAISRARSATAARRGLPRVLDASEGSRVRDRRRSGTA
jgi:hypothetical protein